MSIIKSLWVYVLEYQKHTMVMSVGFILAPAVFLYVLNLYLLLFIYLFKVILQLYVIYSVLATDLFCGIVVVIISKSVHIFHTVLDLRKTTQYTSVHWKLALCNMRPTSLYGILLLILVIIYFSLFSFSPLCEVVIVYLFILMACAKHIIFML